jgi:phosphatidate cytidylyltransferase
MGGLVVGVAAAMFFAAILFSAPNWLFLCSSAILLTGAGIAGDLAESIVKRGTGVKDSGNCLGGHGGILDRIDSLLFAGPVLFYLVTWVR